MTPIVLLGRWLACELDATFAAAGFHRRGTAYERATPESGLIVFFELPPWPSEEVHFRVVLGVRSVLMAKFDERAFGHACGRLAVEACHLQIPFFRLLGEQTEFWWSLAGDERDRELGREFRAWATGIMIPELESRSGDLALRDYLLSVRRERPLAPLSLERLIYLVERLGPRSELPRLTAELDGAAERALAWRHKAVEEEPDPTSP